MRVEPVEVLIDGDSKVPIFLQLERPGRREFVVVVPMMNPSNALPILQRSNHHLPWWTAAGCEKNHPSQLGSNWLIWFNKLSPHRGVNSVNSVKMCKVCKCFFHLLPPSGVRHLTMIMTRQDCYFFRNESAVRRVHFFTHIKYRNCW